MRSVSQPSALQERDLPSSCKSLVLVQSVANKEAFLYLGKLSTSNSCGFNAVELPGELTPYSVSLKLPVSWFTYRPAHSFTNKEAESPELITRRKSPRVREEIRICPRSVPLHLDQLCSI